MPETTTDTKKDIIENIIQKYNLNTRQTWIIGDDPESEIKAAYDLGLKSFLVDRDDLFPNTFATYKVNSLKEAGDILRKHIALKE